MSSLLRAARALAVGVVAVAALTACGPALTEPPPTPSHLDLGAVDVEGTERNGIEYLTGADALTVAIRAMRGGGPVQVSGDYARAGDPDEGIPAGSVRLDFVGTSSAYRATVIADGTTHELHVSGLAAAVRSDAGEWSCVAADAALVRRWAPLLDPAELVAALLGDGSALAVSPPRGAPATVELLLGATEGASGALTVAAEGAALPSRLVLADGSSWAEFAFASWGVDPGIELPGDCAS
ncbi:hypothetical protein [Salinibacterium sp. ZJ77]|uniref:hypothetical protein n=1 Tax=Salinibacterium sp. ZJ77 TaxID=2708337 RepID=UPI0014224080|nr:hypothetical protein [Salinibacterium sp. ZJ77]